MNKYVVLAIGVTAGLIAAPVTMSASAAPSSTCADVYAAGQKADAALWRSAQRHDGRPTRYAVDRWRVDSLYVKSWGIIEGCAS